MDGHQVYPTSWNLDGLSWNPRAMRLGAVVNDNELTWNRNLGSDNNVIGAGGREMRTGNEFGGGAGSCGGTTSSMGGVRPRPFASCALVKPVRCNAPGCEVVFQFSMQSRVQQSSVWCARHRPAATQYHPSSGVGHHHNAHYLSPLSTGEEEVEQREYVRTRLHASSGSGGSREYSASVATRGGGGLPSPPDDDNQRSTSQQVKNTMKNIMLP